MHEKPLDALHGAAVDAACDLDRAYFEENPDRLRYLRHPVAHEACFPGYACQPVDDFLVEVWQIVPGVRARALVPVGVRA